jgi:uncharacterized protein
MEIAGPAGTDLTGWSVDLYNGSGSGGATYGRAQVRNGPIRTRAAASAHDRGSSNGIRNRAPGGIALVDAAGMVVQ